MPKRIALVGIYGGLMREYNPGCFMIAYQTVHELQSRVSGATIDVYSIDLAGRYHDIQTEVEGGLELRFCSAIHQLDVLDSQLMSYDALVIGGDNVWMAAREGIPPGPGNDVFFLNSPKFLDAGRPIVAINCVNSTSPREAIIEDRERFRRACSRARYVAVRSEHLQRILHRDLGIQGVHCFPDPVLGLDVEALAARHPPVRLPRASKPRLGIAVRPALVHALIEAVKHCGSQLDRFEVWFYPFTRLHWHLESVLRVKRAFGAQFQYVEQHLGPLESFQLVRSFDVSMNDTYHGTIAAILHQKPFIPLRFHDAPESRKAQLFTLLGIEDRSIRVRSEGLPPADYDGDVQALIAKLPRLLDDPQVVPENNLAKARALVDEHFGRLAAAIRRS